MSDRQLSMIARLGTLLKIIHQLSEDGQCNMPHQLALRISNRIALVARQDRENRSELEAQLQAAEHDLISGAAEFSRFVKSKVRILGAQSAGRPQSQG